MLVIIDFCKQYRHYVKSKPYTAKIIIDFANLWMFLLDDDLSRKETRR